uniref:Uncharacterized protein n=1 Tax=Phlebotomus papatasi TaxID=29031 RepID=A0A1B0EZZ1_PHLPP
MIMVPNLKAILHRLYSRT